MGLTDDVSAGVSNLAGTASAKAQVAKLKMQLKDLDAKRHDCFARLGERVYEQAKDSPAFADSYAELYAEITAVEEQRASLQAKIDALNSAPVSKVSPAGTVVCPSCGQTAVKGDRFCRWCAALLPTPPKPQVSDGRVCPACGAPSVHAEDRFCRSCGAELPKMPSPVDVKGPQDTEGPHDPRNKKAQEGVDDGDTAEIPKPELPVACPNCGRPSKEGEIFCGECGTRLK